MTFGRTTDSSPETTPESGVLASNGFRNTAIQPAIDLLLTGKQMNNGKTLLLGHSPDPDDAFMFYALAQNRIETHS